MRNIILQIFAMVMIISCCYHPMIARGNETEPIKYKETVYTLTPITEYHVMTGNVIVRSSPDLESVVIGTMKTGQIAISFAQTNIGWYQIKYCGMTGYVYNRNMEQYTGGSKEEVSAKLDFAEEEIRINVLGDSITYGEKVSSQDNIYANLLGAKMGATVVNNYGLRGSTIAGIHPERFIDRCMSMDATANFIIVFGGTNDYGTNTELGSYGDISGETFYGGLNLMMCGLKQRYPDAEVIFLTPLRRLNDSRKNKIGKTLEDYVKAMIKMGEFYDIPVLDLYSAKELDFVKNRYTYMRDGIHPNDKAHVIIANYLEEQLLNVE
ncbi:MAG TPA: GDSL-type esterase/lipase family protein [Lachnospiraceae bacterium]|nr:GDSL-type esterase/lipase family protein [Lachnospiraceae bacterium]